MNCLEETKISKIIKDTFKTKQFKQFFRTGPNLYFGNGCLTVEFTMKNKYQRSVNLYKFEDIVEKFVNNISSKFYNRKIDLKFWDAGSCHIQFVGSNV